MDQDTLNDWIGRRNTYLQKQLGKLYFLFKLDSTGFVL